MDRLKLPKYYILDTTNHCNFRCPICPNENIKDSNKGMMSFDLFLHILDQIKDIAVVIQLYWMGEPLLNSYIYKMISYCKKNTNAKIMISTNGSLLNEKTINALKQSGLDEIIISVDACDSQEIYEAIRCGGSISRLNSNIRMLLNNKGNINVVLQFINMYVNEGEKKGFIKQWEKEDCTISIIRLYSWADQLTGLSLASTCFRNNWQRPRIPCADLWNKMAIHWDGIVSACCFDWDSKLALGDSNNTMLVDIWNGAEASIIRELHTSQRYSDLQLCNRCDSWAEPDEYIELFHLA